MSKTSRYNSVVASCGLAALGLYVLACRPAFSPDGTQVLFPSVDPQTTHLSVNRFNLVTRQTDVIFSYFVPEGTPVLSPQWMADGQRAVITMAAMNDDSSLRVVVLPMGNHGPTRLFELDGEDDSALSLVVPPPLMGSYLYLGGKSLRRLNLETGELKSAETVTEGELYLHRHGDQLYYWGERKEDAGVFELGKLDQDHLTRTPLARLDKKDVGDVSAFISIAPEGSRIALTSQKDQQASVLVISGSTVAQTILVGSSAEPVQLGNTQWALNGKTIYATALRPSGSSDQSELGLMEIPLDGAAARFTSLLSLQDDADEAALYFQIALSPDGKTIAAGSCYLDVEGTGELKETDRALFILDLESPQRPVTKIQIPLPVTSRAK